MLKIRKEQMEVLSNYMLEQFEDRMVVHLRSMFPEKMNDLDKPELRAMIQTSIDKAEEYNVTDETDVKRYLECMVCYGPDFDTDSKTFWSGQILGDQNLTGTEKMNQINDYELFVLAGDS